MVNKVELTKNYMNIDNTNSESTDEQAVLFFRDYSFTTSLITNHRHVQFITLNIYME